MYVSTQNTVVVSDMHKSPGPSQVNHVPQLGAWFPTGMALSPCRPFGCRSREATRSCTWQGCLLCSLSRGDCKVSCNAAHE